MTKVLSVHAWNYVSGNLILALNFQLMYTSGFTKGNAFMFEDYSVSKLELKHISSQSFFFLITKIKTYLWLDPEKFKLKGILP